jgi:hypothetical protein
MIVTAAEDAQAQLDAWVAFYNHDRPHQSLGMAAPWKRFRLASTASTATTADAAPTAAAASDTPPVVPSATRKVSAGGMISFASTRYKAGRWLAGETVDIVCDAAWCTSAIEGF